MRKIAFLLIVPLAACASVEERTDARSGTGFSSTTIDGASGGQATSQQVTMQGFESIPVVAVSGFSGDLDDAAEAALNAGGSNSGSWASMTAGGESYALRQVRAGSYQFAVADPDDGGDMSQAVLTQTEVRTGCKTTGQTWDDKGRFAMALDCS